jgi:tetratricopeptide (TPR) repeat protein
MELASLDLLEQPKRLEPLKETTRRLYLLSGNQCAFPDCDNAMVNDDGVFIGNIAHIEGVKGERFNPRMTNEQRRSFENLVLLCYVHHQVTNDEVAWPVARMREMKAKHEGAVNNLRTVKIIAGDIPREPHDFVFSQKVGLAAKKVQDGEVAVLVGPRGAGKTQAAASYARSMCKERWGIVAWVNAETTDTLLSGLARLAERMGVADLEHDSLQSALNLRDILESRRVKAVLVLDNATDPDRVRQILPSKGRVRVIITTTNRTFAALGQTVDIDGFSKDEAIAFLAKATTLTDTEGAANIAYQLAYLPVALAQAAGTIRCLHLSSSDYLFRLDNYQISDVLERRLGDDYPRSTAAAILMSLATVGGGGGAAELLSLVAFLAPTGVRRDWLYATADASESPNHLDTDAALASCIDNSLLTWSADGQIIAVHRLVARVLRERDTVNGTFDANAQAAMALVEQHLIMLEHAWNERVKGRELVGHVEAACANVRAHPDPAIELREQAASLRDWAVEHLLEVSDFSRAVPMAIQGLNDAIDLFGMDAPRTWACYNRAGWAQIAANRAEAGLRDLEAAVSAMSRILGPQHPSTISARKDLAASYRDAGRLDIAVPMARSVVDDAEIALGPVSDVTVSAWSCYAYALQVADLPAESVSAYRHVYELRKANLGPYHPKTLWSQGCLASAYHAAGRLDESIITFREVVTAQEGMDPSNSATYLTQANLARLLEERGDINEAMALYKSSLAGRESSLGWEHPRTVDSRILLAQAYERTGDQPEAISLWQDIVRARKQVLGAEHADLQWAQDELARAVAMVT